MARKPPRKADPAGKDVSTAIRDGRKRAAEVFERRARIRRRRNALVRKQAQAVRRRGGEQAAAAERMLARASTGTLVAEGDSWFDYPFYDILKLLDDEYGYEIHAVAHRGDPVETMAYGGGQLDDFARVLEQVLLNGTPPRAILLSGGGNDVAGDQFAMLINHKLSPAPGLNPQVLQGVLQQRIRLAYITIISAVTHLSEQHLGRTVPVIVHGYGHPVPDGRGFLGGFGPLPGPWLEPSFRDKGYDVLTERIAIAAELIDAFNAMIAGIASLPDFAHVRYVDLRPELSNDPSNYRRSWGNELHPTERGFEAVTRRIAGVIAALP